MDIYDKKSEEGIMDFEEFFDRFHNFVRHSRFSLEAVWRPSIDIVESDEEVIIFAELAGVNKSEVEITYKDGILRLRGNRKQPYAQNKKKFTQLEIEHGRFERLIKIEEKINAEEISVNLEEGILKIRLPFKERRKIIKVEIEE